MGDVQILVVEDENIVAIDLRMRLLKLGYSVIGLASSGEEALTKMRTLLPDLVLMVLMETDMHLHPQPL